MGGLQPQLWRKNVDRKETSTNSSLPPSNDYPMGICLSSTRRRHWSYTSAWRETVPVVWLDSAVCVSRCGERGSGLLRGNAYLRDPERRLPIQAGVSWHVESHHLLCMHMGGMDS